MPRQLQSEAIQLAEISLEHCDWYSPSVVGGVGALKLPRGNTDERPTTATGGRENINIDLTVSQPDVYSTDPAFIAGDPWIWAWSGNYNRNAFAATTVASGTQVSGLTLLRGSTYNFRNGSVGHNLWLRSAEKTDANDPDNVYALGAADGVTNNGAIKAQPSDAAAVVTWVIPSNYSANIVYVQHKQTGMVNTVTIADPPAETLGYIRLNTDIGHDEITQTGLEVYTGAGWKTIPYSDNAGGTKTHPTGTLLTDDNGNVADSITSSADNASVADATASTEDFENLLVTAFLADGDISMNPSGVSATKTLVLHDGATGGGVPMLRADMSNVPIKKANKTVQYLTGTDGTYTSAAVAGTPQSRIVWTEQAAGHDIFTLQDSGKELRIANDINNNTWIKFTLDLYINGASHQAYIDFRKNGVREELHWLGTTANHYSMTRMIQLSFNDVITIHITNGSTIDSIAISDIHLFAELVGS